MGRLRKTLYGHEDLVETYEQCLKTENERLDREESERKTARQLTAPNTKWQMIRRKLQPTETTMVVL